MNVKTAALASPLRRGVVAVALTQTAPEGIQLAAAGVRAASFAGMGLALLLAARPEKRLADRQHDARW